MFVFGAFLGSAKPESFWKLALVLACFLPALGVAHLLITGHTELLVKQGLGSLLAFIPAFCGTYTGRLIRTKWVNKQKA
ncbi:hypothetical protein [Thermoflavimicrobium dichotomicum]|uniref:hypothetical protein n=1 Tax=Thermoflavimicrobium dichotomicum TaxID=46223 RepID=UPI001113F555|nr:hypothetical protein [Thermoflavimicrobium dichotomicum]